ncbi:sigma-70 family RNA polymerase sigma factor [bacterium AH-315-E10]|nr:sigma-70 family RNA polymerase sigma factor [bacterium AH-315-E10]
MPDLTDNERLLIEKKFIMQAKAGVSEAFSELVTIHQGRLRAFASRYMHEPNDVYDIVQEAFLEAYRKIDRFDEDKEFGPWIRVICKNKILNVFRSQKVRKNINIKIVDDALLNMIEFDKENDSSLKQDRIEVLKECLNDLPQDQLELIELRYHSGLSIKEMAETFEMKAGSIAMQLSRIRSHLKKEMYRKLNERRY